MLGRRHGLQLEWIQHGVVGEAREPGLSKGRGRGGLKGKGQTPVELQGGAVPDSSHQPQVAMNAGNVASLH